MHEVLIPEIVNGKWNLKTRIKEAFVDFIGTDHANLHGIVIMESFHRTCPSGKNSIIKHLKILGTCSNNDGIRPSSGSGVDGIFIKTSDDYDYARDPHTVVNSVFWTGVNGAVSNAGIPLQQNVIEDIAIENPNVADVGYIKDFTFKNIKVEYPFQIPNGTACKHTRLRICLHQSHC